MKVVALACLLASAGLASAVYFDEFTVYGGNESGNSLVLSSNPFGNGGVLVNGVALSPLNDATVTEATDLGGRQKNFGNIYLAGQLHLRSQGMQGAYANLITSPYQTASWTWVLPIAQGAAGTVLTNNGVGTLSWGSCVPNGAVMQFNRESCPAGWKPFKVVILNGLTTCEKQ